VTIYCYWYRKPFCKVVMWKCVDLVVAMQTNIVRVSHLLFLCELMLVQFVLVYQTLCTVLMPYCCTKLGFFTLETYDMIFVWFNFQDTFREA